MTKIQLSKADFDNYFITTNAFMEKLQESLDFETTETDETDTSEETFTDETEISLRTGLSELMFYTAKSQGKWRVTHRHPKNCIHKGPPEKSYRITNNGPGKVWVSYIHNNVQHREELASGNSIDRTGKNICIERAGADASGTYN